MTKIAKIGATVVVIILFLLLNSYMSMEKGRATGAGILGFVFLVGALTAIWRSKTKNPSNATSADKEKLDKGQGNV